MALSTTTFCLVLGCLTLSLFHYSSGTKQKQTYCSKELFYCPTSYRCLDRQKRCIPSKVCTTYSNKKEAKCFESKYPGVYYYFRKKSPLASSGSSSKRKRSINDLMHWFVQYRGFVYEFGPGYSVQELDVNDPNYKYGPGGREIVSRQVMGWSRCTRDQILSFVDKWLRANPNYHAFSNNCQDFAKKLLKELKNSCRNRVKRQDDDTESLKAPSECYSNTSSSFRWKLQALFAPLISFAIFYNIN